MRKEIVGNCQLYLGNSLDVLPDISGVHACVTDPPYELGFMGKGWDSSGIANNKELWRKVLDAVLPGAHLLAFGGSRTYHRMTCAIEDAGFEIRDQIMWLYGSGFPKSHNLDGDHEGWGTALKPAHEPISFARKPLTGTVAKNVSDHGCGALNIDGCRVPGEDAQGGGYTVKRLKPGATLEKTGGNWRAEEGVEFHGTMKPGRWPANVIHDGSDEVLASFPEADGQQGAVTGREPSSMTNNVYGAFNGRPETRPRIEVNKSAARFYYCAKASKSDRDEGLTTPEQPIVTFATANGTSGKASSISAGRDTSYRNNHPTVKPTDLIRYLCRLVTPPGGVVLDPFMGSGSTGKAAVREGFSFVGIEQDAAYFDIACRRIEAANSHRDSVVRDQPRMETPTTKLHDQLPLFDEISA